MGLRYRYQDYEVGKFNIRLRMLRDLDQYEETGGRAEEAGISREAFPLFGIVWASSEVLSRLMLGYDLTDKRVLEIGCGMALASHVMNALGADITAMDIHPVTEELITSNAILNNAPRIPFLNASWGDDTSILGEFDLIVGSDVLYEPKHIKTLAAFLDRHAGPSSEVLIVDPDRGQLEAFQADMSKAGFTCKTFSPDFEDHLGVRYSGSIHQYLR